MSISCYAQNKTYYIFNGYYLNLKAKAFLIALLLGIETKVSFG